MRRRSALAIALTLLVSACTTVTGKPVPAADPPRPADAQPPLTIRPVLAPPLPYQPVKARETGLPRVLPKAGRERAVELAREDYQDPWLLSVPPARAALALNTHSCLYDNPLAGYDDPVRGLVSCDRTGRMRYLMGPVVLDSRDIVSAEAREDEQGHVVLIHLTGRGVGVWAELTRAQVGKQVALLFNTAVLMAPTVEEPMDGEVMRVYGDFSRAEAEELAAAVAG